MCHGVDFAIVARWAIQPEWPLGRPGRLTCSHRRPSALDAVAQHAEARSARGCSSPSPVIRPSRVAPAPGFENTACVVTSAASSVRRATTGVASECARVFGPSAAVHPCGWAAAAAWIRPAGVRRERRGAHAGRCQREHRGDRGQASLVAGDAHPVRATRCRGGRRKASARRRAGSGRRGGAARSAAATAATTAATTAAATAATAAATAATAASRRSNMWACSPCRE